MAKYQRPKGTHDLIPGAPAWEDDSDRWHFLEDTFRALCRLYGYREVRTPAFEPTELFVRAVGEGTDIVSKEMYSFEDRGGRSMTLRPEGTAPALRAYVDGHLGEQGGVTKLYYNASIFRYERPQRGRFRQHQQFGVEALGSDDPALDAEVIEMALAFFRHIGIRSLTLKLNSVGSPASRARYVEDLKAFVEPFLADFSEEGQARFVHNPLRMLDTKSEKDMAILQDAPSLPSYLSDEERAHFDTVCEHLRAAGVEFLPAPRLVRGFDYYTKTAFEVQSPDLGAQDALGGGGRYNRLVEEIGGPPTPGIGFGLGVERALIALQALGTAMPPPQAPTAYIITLGEAPRSAGVRLLAELRAAGIAADIEYGGRSMKAQMRAADRSRARCALILGDEELAHDVVQYRSLTDHWQHAVPRAEIVEWLSSDRQPPA